MIDTPVELVLVSDYVDARVVRGCHTSFLIIKEHYRFQCFDQESDRATRTSNPEETYPANVAEVLYLRTCPLLLEQ